MDSRVEVSETYMRPTPEWPDGSYLRKVAGNVEVATGYYATLYPGKPSPYWHGGAPYFVLEHIETPWGGEHMTRCPKCNSPRPHLHPAVQFEGEVQPCDNDYHRQITPENTRQKIAENDRFLRDVMGKEL